MLPSFTSILNTNIHSFPQKYIEKLSADDHFEVADIVISIVKSNNKNIVVSFANQLSLDKCLITLDKLYAASKYIGCIYMRIYTSGLWSIL